MKTTRLPVLGLAVLVLVEAKELSGQTFALADSYRQNGLVITADPWPSANTPLCNGW